MLNNNQPLRTRKRVNKKDVVKDIKKTIVSKKKKEKEVVITTSSGIDVLDLALSGGYPFRRIINIVGDSSTGKTLLATEFIAKCCFLYGKKLKWFYDDVEERYSFNTKKMYSELNKFEVVKKNQENSETIEDFKNNFKNKISRLKPGEKFIYVLDSFDELGSEAELKREKKKENTKDGEGKGTYNLEKQKELGSFFRTQKKHIKNNEVILIIISQIRVKIGVTFGAKHYRTGGKALDHMASVIMWLAEVEKLRKKGRSIGVTTKAKITKVGNDRPFRECFIDILFDYGVDNIRSNICFLYDLRTDQGKLKAKAETDKKLKWDGKEYSLKGLVRYIENNNLEEELKNRCFEKWEEIEASIKTVRKSKFSR